LLNYIGIFYSNINFGITKIRLHKDYCEFTSEEREQERDDLSDEFIRGTAELALEHT
jgi:hypothetical protein